MGQASARAQEFDLPGALALLKEAASDGACDEAGAQFEYVEGLLGAAEAARQGGTVDSLRDVRSAVHALLWRAAGKGGVPNQRSLDRGQPPRHRAIPAVAVKKQVDCRLALRYVEQTEVLVDLPDRIHRLHELAGDLWLQVHRFEDARRAYERATEHVGRTSRITFGLGRAAARLQDGRTACAEYRRLLDWWGPRAALPPEIEEARMYLASPACTTTRQ